MHACQAKKDNKLEQLEKEFTLTARQNNTETVKNYCIEKWSDPKNIGGFKYEVILFKVKLASFKIFQPASAHTLSTVSINRVGFKHHHVVITATGFIFNLVSLQLPNIHKPLADPLGESAPMLRGFIAEHPVTEGTEFERWVSFQFMPCR